MAAQEPRVPGASRWWAPSRAGKTTLLEAILARTGAIQRQGTIEAGTTVGDASKEARHHKMSVELSVATTTFMGDSYTFIDCPGSVEFVHDMRAALPAVDAAVVVCEADEKKVPQLQLILRELEELNIPRFLFLNKIDKAETKLMEALQLLQPASRKPLVLRQIPIWKNDIVTGFVDLALERAHVYKEHAASEVVPLEGESLEQEKTARFSMLEKLADHDDELMEQLLEDIPPPRDKVFDDLAKELREGLVVPGADGRRDPHQRRAAPAQGAASRVAECRDDRQAPRRRRRRRRLPMCSRPSTPAMPARCRSCACSQGRSATASRSCRPSARSAASPARSSCWASRARSAGRLPPAKPSRSASSNTPGPATR